MVITIPPPTPHLERGLEAIFYSIKHFVSIFLSVCPLIDALRIAVYLYYKFVHGIQNDTWTAHAQQQGETTSEADPPPLACRCSPPYNRGMKPPRP